MNKPIEYHWTEKDIIEGYKKYNDKKTVARIYCISVKEVAEILKRSRD